MLEGSVGLYRWVWRQVPRNPGPPELGRIPSGPAVSRSVSLFFVLLPAVAELVVSTSPKGIGAILRLSEPCISGGVGDSIAPVMHCGDGWERWALHRACPGLLWFGRRGGYL